jgi:hypothetical protein
MFVLIFIATSPWLLAAARTIGTCFDLRLDFHETTEQYGQGGLDGPALIFVLIFIEIPPTTATVPRAPVLRICCAARMRCFAHTRSCRRGKTHPSSAIERDSGSFACYSVNLLEIKRKATSSASSGRELLI